MAESISLVKQLPRHQVAVDPGWVLDVPPVMLNIDREAGARMPYWINDDDTVPPLVPSVVLTGEPERDLIQCRQCGCSWSEHCADHYHGAALVPSEYNGWQTFLLTDCVCHGMVA